MATSAKKNELSRSVLEQAGKHIVGLFTFEIPADPEVFEAVGTPLATQKFEDGTFKNKPVQPGQEFFLSESYVGKSGKVIFMFKPVDSREYEHIEVDEQKIAGIFPDMGGRATKRLEWAKHSGQDLDIPSIVKTLYGDILRAEKAEKEQAKVVVETKYADVPNFGRF